MSKSEKTRKHCVKLFVCGSKGVGKTAQVKNLLNRNFENEYIPTDRADMHMTKIKIEENIFNVEICDVSGNQKDILEAKAFFPGSAIALIVFDICDYPSFFNVEYWLQILAENNPDPNLMLAIVGNKNDQAKDRKVDYETVKSLADQNNVIYFETSAKETKTALPFTRIGDLLEYLLQNYLKSAPERYSLSDSFDSQEENQSESYGDTPDTKKKSYRENLNKFQEQIMDNNQFFEDNEDHDDEIVVDRDLFNDYKNEYNDLELSGIPKDELTSEFIESRDSNQNIEPKSDTPNKQDKLYESRENVYEKGKSLFKNDCDKLHNKKTEETQLESIHKKNSATTNYESNELNCSNVPELDTELALSKENLFNSSHTKPSLMKKSGDFFFLKKNLFNKDDQSNRKDMFCHIKNDNIGAKNLALNMFRYDRISEKFSKSIAERFLKKDYKSLARQSLKTTRDSYCKNQSSTSTLNNFLRASSFLKTSRKNRIISDDDLVFSRESNLFSQTQINSARPARITILEKNQALYGTNRLYESCVVKENDYKDLKDSEQSYSVDFETLFNNVLISKSQKNQMIDSKQPTNRTDKSPRIQHKQPYPYRKKNKVAFGKTEDCWVHKPLTVQKINKKMQVRMEEKYGQK